MLAKKEGYCYNYQEQELERVKKDQIKNIRKKVELLGLKAEELGFC